MVKNDENADFKAWQGEHAMWLGQHDLASPEDPVTYSSTVNPVKKPEWKKPTGESVHMFNKSKEMTMLPG